MAGAPVSMTKRLSAAQKIEVSGWWSALSCAERRSLSLRVRPQLVARFVDDPFYEPTSVDFYEYLVNHEIELEDHGVQHICSAHREARAAIGRGFVHADFVCPRRESTCPMRALLDLAPGRHLKLVRA